VLPRGKRFRISAAIIIIGALTLLAVSSVLCALHVADKLLLLSAVGHAGASLDPSRVSSGELNRSSCFPFLQETVFAMLSGPLAFC
jgi:hypothetical protein